MGLFDFFKKGKNNIKTAKQATSSLETQIAKHRVSCNFTAAQQREWLTTLNQTIPTILLGEIPLCVDYHLTPRMLAEAGSMLNTVGRIAFCVAQTLSATNIEKALKTHSEENLLRTYCILDEYSKILKAPYSNQISTVNAYIYKVLCKTDLKNTPTDKKENVLFWAPSIYDGDPLTLPSPDYEIHIFPEAAKMINNGTKVQTDNALPKGYKFAQKGSGKILHLRTIRNPQLNQEMIPLFTDPNLLLQIFTPNTRLSIVDYQTARRFCLQEKNICSGIVINPGRDNKIISVDQLEQESGVSGRTTMTAMPTHNRPIQQKRECTNVKEDIPEIEQEDEVGQMCVSELMEIAKAEDLSIIISANEQGKRGKIFNNKSLPNYIVLRQSKKGDADVYCDAGGKKKEKVYEELSESVACRKALRYARAIPKEQQKESVEEKGVLEWSLDENGTLVLSGNGPMIFALVQEKRVITKEDLMFELEYGDYTLNEGDVDSRMTLPWGQVRKVVVKPGLTDVSSFVFKHSSVGFGNGPYGNLTEIFLPDTVEKLSCRAVCDCPNLEKVVVPASVKTIDKTVFDRCPKLVIYTTKGSYAEEYAKAKGITVKIVDDLEEESVVQCEI